MRVLLLFPLLLALALPARAGEADPLLAFLTGFTTLRADFEQTTYDQNGRLTQRARGFLAIQRPGRFRWDYQAPYLQQIVADGERLWFFDADLEQVTVKPQAEALGDTPGALLTDGEALAREFEVRFAYRRDGLDWYSLEPRRGDATFERLDLAMKDGVLARMELLDSFGQLTELRFENLRTGVELDSALFRLDLPEGVDVIDETR